MLFDCNNKFLFWKVRTKLWCSYLRVTKDFNVQKLIFLIKFSYLYLKLSVKLTCTIQLETIKKALMTEEGEKYSQLVP